jgi:hypothetical protein
MRSATSRIRRWSRLETGSSKIIGAVMPANRLGEEISHRQDLLLALRQHLGRLDLAADHLAALGFTLASDEVHRQLGRSESRALLVKECVKVLFDQLVTGRLGQCGHSAAQCGDSLGQDREPLGFFRVVDLSLDCRPRSREFRCGDELIAFFLLLRQGRNTVLGLRLERCVPTLGLVVGFADGGGETGQVFCVERDGLGCVDGPLKPCEEGMCPVDRVVERRSARVAVCMFGEERRDVRRRRLAQPESCGSDRLIGCADVGTDLVSEVVTIFGYQAACYIGERLAAVQAVVGIVGADLDEV